MAIWLPGDDALSNAFLGLDDDPLLHPGRHGAPYTVDITKLPGGVVELIEFRANEGIINHVSKHPWIEYRGSSPARQLNFSGDHLHSGLYLTSTSANSNATMHCVASPYGSASNWYFSNSHNVTYLAIGTTPDLTCGNLGSSQLPNKGFRIRSYEVRMRNQSSNQAVTWDNSVVQARAVAFRKKPVSNFYVWVNGLYQGSAGAGSTDWCNSATNYIASGATWTESTGNFSGDHLTRTSFLVAWRRQLDDEEMEQVTGQPYAFVVPAYRGAFPAPEASAGTDFTGTGTQGTGAGTGQSGTGSFGFTGTGTQGTGAGTGRAGTILCDYIDTGFAGTGAGTGHAGTVDVGTVIDFTGTGQAGTGATLAGTSTLVLTRDDPVSLATFQPELLLPHHLKPTGQLAPVGIPQDYASVAMLDDNGTDNVLYHGPGGIYGNIDRFVNTSHTWRPEGPVMASNNTALRTSGTVQLSSNDFTTFMWWRFTGGTVTNYQYFFYSNYFESYSFRRDNTTSTFYTDFFGNISESSVPVNINDGNWHLITKTRSSVTNQKNTVWIDDHKILSNTSSISGLSADFMCWGGRDDSSARQSDGQVGIAGYYDRTLDVSETEDMYWEGFGAFKPVSQEPFLRVVEGAESNGSGAFDFIGTGTAGTGAGTGQEGQLTVTGVISFNGTGDEEVGAGTGRAGTVVADYLPANGSQDVGAGTGQGGQFAHGWSGSGSNGTCAGTGQNGQGAFDFLGTADEDVGAGTGYAGTFAHGWSGTGDEEVGAGTGYAGTLTVTTAISFSGTATAGTATGTGQAGTVVADYIDSGDEDVGAGTGYGGTLTLAFVGEGSYEDGGGTGYAGTVLCDFIDTGATGTATGTGQAGSIASGFTGSGTQGTAAGTGQAGQGAFDFVGSGQGGSYYSEDFEGYSDGDDPTDWLDTEAGNALTEDDTIYDVDTVSSNKVFGTDNTQTNIHSHYTGSAVDGLSEYELNARVRFTASSSGVGFTVFSDYPNTDAYYRIRRYNTVDWHLEPHGTTVAGTTDSGVSATENTWYRVRLQVEDTGSRTEIRAKVWEDGNSEPSSWQIDAYDDTGSRLTSGTFGVWDMATGSKYYDDIEVTALGGGGAGETGAGTGQVGTFTSTIGFLGTGTQGTGVGTGRAGTFAYGWSDAGDEEVGAGAGHVGQITIGGAFVGAGFAGTAAGTGRTGTVVADHLPGNGTQGTGAGTGYAGTGSFGTVIHFTGAGAQGTAAGTGQAGTVSADSIGEGSQEVGAGTGHTGTGAFDFIGAATEGDCAGTGQGGTEAHGFSDACAQGTGAGTGHAGTGAFGSVIDFTGTGTQGTGAGTSYAGTFAHGWSDTGTNGTAAGTGHVGQLALGGSFIGAGFAGTAAGTGRVGTFAHGWSDSGSTETGAGTGQGGTQALGWTGIGQQETGSGTGHAGQLTTSASLSFTGAGVAGTAAGTTYAGTLLTDQFLVGDEEVGAGTGWAGTGAIGSVIPFVGEGVQGTAAGTGYAGTIISLGFSGTSTAQVAAGVGYIGDASAGVILIGDEDTGLGTGYPGTSLVTGLDGQAGTAIGTGWPGTAILAEDYTSREIVEFALSVSRGLDAQLSITTNVRGTAVIATEYPVQLSVSMLAGPFVAKITRIHEMSVEL